MRVRLVGVLAQVSVMLPPLQLLPKRKPAWKPDIIESGRRPMLCIWARKIIPFPLTWINLKLHHQVTFISRASQLWHHRVRPKVQERWGEEMNTLTSRWYKRSMCMPHSVACIAAFKSVSRGRSSSVLQTLALHGYYRMFNFDVRTCLRSLQVPRYASCATVNCKLSRNILDLDTPSGFSL